LRASDHRLLLRALRDRRSGGRAHINLAGSDLRGAQLSGADLVEVDLSGADLRHASLAGARLMRSNLQGAQLSHCRFDGSDLTDANLSLSDLSEATMDDCVLAGADLRGASLKGLLGTPLSLAASLMDDETIERSAIDDRGVNSLVKRGVLFEEEETIPSSMRSLLEEATLSLEEALRSSESAERHRVADPDTSLPSSRPFSFEILSSRTLGIRRDTAPPSSQRPLPIVSAEQIEHYRPPEIGEIHLGVLLKRELSSSLICRTFVGTTSDEAVVVYKTFNPACDGAPLHLPAFQRGLRALNHVQPAKAGQENFRKAHVSSLLTVANDLTAFVTPYYENGSIENLVDVHITLEAALELFEKICESFVYLHKHGVLVRSVKPGKILINGLEPVLGEVDMVDLPTLRQHSGDLDGYGPYVAPEEIGGQGTRSPTACVFVLGRLFEYLLTGKRPVTPYGAVPNFPAHIPEPLGRLVARCTRLNPIDRHPYVEDVLEAIHNFQRAGTTAHLESWIRPGTLSLLNPPPLSIMALAPNHKSRAPFRSKYSNSTHPQTQGNRMTRLAISTS